MAPDRESTSDYLERPVSDLLGLTPRLRRALDTLHISTLKDLAHADLAATIFTLLGIDPRGTLHTADGRPVQISRDGKVVNGLVS